MKRKKRNTKNIKKSSNIIFVVLVILLVVFYIYKTSTLKDNNIEKNNTKKEDNQEKKIDSDESIKKEDESTPYKKTSNFKLENLNRYEAYKDKNPNLDYETVVTYVNIGLDYDFYDYIKDADLSKDILVLTNKYSKLPDGYEPSDLEEISSEYFINGNTLVRNLRKEAKEAFEKLSKASIENGTPVYGQSAYRPYSMQESLYNQEVQRSGVKGADSDTARPGHSEHQTGLAIDVASEKWGNMYSFDKSSSYEWMNKNAHKYGFILRYRKEYENIHGYIYEGWHYRYVGVKVATDIHDNYPNMTYDEYYYKFIDKK